MPAAPTGVYSSILSSDHTDATVEGYFNENVIKVDKKLNLNLFASWKDIDPGKKLNLRLKRYQMA